LIFRGCQAERHPDRFPEASDHVDCGTISQRHQRADAGHRHQAPTHSVVRDDSQYAAGAGRRSARAVTLLKFNPLCALAASINRSPATLSEQRLSWKKRSLHRKEEVLGNQSPTAHPMKFGYRIHLRYADISSATLTMEFATPASKHVGRADVCRVWKSANRLRLVCSFSNVLRGTLD
jgi:hypothetical protein